MSSILTVNNRLSETVTSLQLALDYAPRYHGGMKDVKAMTVRLPADQASELEAVANADGVSVAEAVREAIAQHVATRRKDKAFQKRLRRLVDSNREILDRLAQ